MNPNNNHPGWWYSPSTSTTFTSEIMGDGLVTGDIVNIPLNPPGDYDTYPTPTAECGDDLIDYWVSEGECIEFVLWQINYGSTWYQGNGGWASLASNPDFAPGTYQDQNCNNSWYMCRDENPGAAVASPDFDCPPDAPDAIIDDIEFEIGCIGNVPAYQLTYTVWNYGNEPITNYCIEIWNEDYYQCFNDSMFGGYDIPVGEGQQFTTPFFEYDALGSFFTMTVDNVNDEIVTGNNNTTVYYPDELDELICPEICEPDTIIEYEYDTIYIELPPEIVYDTLTIVDVIDSLIYITDTLYIELPPDTIIELETDTIYIPWEWYIYDTVYVDNFIYTTVFDTIYVELPPDTVIVTETEFVVDTLYIDNYIYEYDTTYITETDTLYLTLTDTITEYIVQELWIDCNTGLPCDEDPPGLECPGWITLHVPNTFTPNNDGLNDVWKIMYDLNCWENVEFEIYNRWGNKIYHGYGDSYDSYPYWDGSVNGGDHYVEDGVYVYLIKGKKIGRVETIKKQGFISIFR
jgi:gliding motility-associated-like protein